MALLYVLGELLPVGRRLSWEVTLWGLLAGFLLGVATELILAVGGAERQGPARNPGRCYGPDARAGMAAAVESPAWPRNRRWKAASIERSSA